MLGIVITLRKEGEPCGLAGQGCALALAEAFWFSLGRLSLFQEMFGDLLDTRGLLSWGVSHCAPQALLWPREGGKGMVAEAAKAPQPLNSSE